MFLLTKADVARALLVEKLKRDPTSPARWLALLKWPPSYEAKLYSKVRLFRRATTLIDKETCRHDRSYVELMVLFAKLKGCVWLTRSNKYERTDGCSCVCVCVCAATRRRRATRSSS